MYRRGAGTIPTSGVAKCLIETLARRKMDGQVKNLPHVVHSSVGTCGVTSRAGTRKKCGASNDAGGSPVASR